MAITTWSRRPRKDEICTKESPWKKGDQAKCHPDSIKISEERYKDQEGFSHLDGYWYRCNICGVEFLDN